VILFGSVARQEKDLESDIDLLVLTTRTITWQERKSIIDTLFEIQRKYRVLFSPLIIENHEWKEGPLSLLPIHGEIDKDGIST
jgi:predicted nucleotidyltransferase